MSYEIGLKVLVIMASNIPLYIAYVAILYVGSFLILGKRLPSIFDPGHVYLTLAITYFASFLLFYQLPGVTWTYELVAIVSAFVPFFLFYGRGRHGAANAGITIAKAGFSLADVQVLAFIVAAIVIFQAVAVMVASGFRIGGSGETVARLNLLKTSVILTYTEPAAITVAPTLLWIFHKNRKMTALMLLTIVIYMLKMVFVGSKAAVLMPVLNLLSYFFFRRLDLIAVGTRYPPLFAQKSYWKFMVVGGAAIAFLLAGSGASLNASGIMANAISGSSSTLSLSRFMLGFDSAIYSGVVDLTTSNAKPYCVICSYAAFTKLLSPALAPKYNNFGEYYGANVLKLNFDKGPATRYLTLPNSTMPLEFLYSFGFAPSVVLIFLYSTFVMKILRRAEKNRYKNIRWLIVFSYLVFNPLEYIFDGASFIFGIYGAIIVYAFYTFVVFFLKKAKMMTAHPQAIWPSPA